MTGADSAIYLPRLIDLRAVLPAAVLVAGIAANLLIPFFTAKPKLPCTAVTFFVLIFAAVAALVGGQHGLLFRGLLIGDSAGDVFQAILLFFAAAVIVLWAGHSGRTMPAAQSPEFLVLLLGATLGMCLMGSTTHLAMIFPAVALASLPSYAMTAFGRRDPRAAEASMKYVLFGAVTAAVMVYGISLIYGATGTLQLADFSAHPAALGLVSVGLLGLGVGIAFKVSAVPLHFWCPDVFQAAPIEVTTFLSVASKGAGLMLAMRVAQFAGNVVPTQAILVVVGSVAAITITVGNTAAFAQRSVKRLLAYSSIAQAGYMLCLPAILPSVPSDQRAAVVGALLVYLLIYAAMNLGAFAVTAAVSRDRGDDDLSGFFGLNRSAPTLAAAMLCCLISLIGLPPVAGFGVKLNVLWLLSQTGTSGAILLSIVAVNTVVSAVYYFRVVRAMYLQPAPARWRLFDPVSLLIAGGAAVALVACFVWLGPLMSATAKPLAIQ